MKHSDQQHYDTIVNGVGRIGFCRGGKSATWDDETMSEAFLERAKNFVSENKEKAFFLYYALHQPHVPRIPSPRFAGVTGKGPRGDVIAELDWCVGEILAHLKAEGLDKTRLLFSPAITDRCSTTAMMTMLAKSAAHTSRLAHYVGANIVCLMADQECR